MGRAVRQPLTEWQRWRVGFECAYVFPVLLWLFEWFGLRRPIRYALARRWREHRRTLEYQQHLRRLWWQRKVKS